MTKQGDRRRVALAAALQVALSLVRLVHMNRSLCISQSPVAFWLEAFRGKGKRQGARRPFKWAMIRQGITDLDVAQIIYDAWSYWSSAKVSARLCRYGPNDWR